MTFEPIERLEIENYGCIKKVSLPLSRLHALIGPNDSGKTTILRAVRILTQFAKGTFDKDGQGWLPFDPMLDRTDKGFRVSATYFDDLSYQCWRPDDSNSLTETVIAANNERHSKVREGWNHPGLLSSSAAPTVFVIKGRLCLATLVRFDPDSLRAPASLIPENHGLKFSDDRGSGLAAVIDGIMNRDFEGFLKIQAEVQRLFPVMEKLGLSNVSESNKEIAITLTGGTRLSAREISEGMLYYVGFLALQHIEDSRLFLVEEPENGLHPARIHEVMAILRRISEQSQVIVATHSPLVVNELYGDEVSVVTRDPKNGTGAILLKDVPHFDDASKIYQPGELWLSYADGKFETPLLSGTPRP